MNAMDWVGLKNQKRLQGKEAETMRAIVRR